jgi:hypothetical protein
VQNSQQGTLRVAQGKQPSPRWPTMDSGTSSMTGIGQSVPSASRMEAQTDS